MIYVAYNFYGHLIASANSYHELLCVLESKGIDPDEDALMIGRFTP